MRHKFTWDPPDPPTTLTDALPSPSSPRCTAWRWDPVGSTQHQHGDGIRSSLVRNAHERARHCTPARPQSPRRGCGAGRASSLKPQSKFLWLTLSSNPAALSQVALQPGSSKVPLKDPTSVLDSLDTSLTEGTAGCRGDRPTTGQRQQWCSQDMRAGTWPPL